MNEEYFLNDDGQVVNSSLLDYRLPTSLDLPMIDTVIVEVPEPRPPLRRPRVSAKPTSSRLPAPLPTPSPTPSASGWRPSQ